MAVDYIPEGVIINILKRVHVTTLLRCTCVCKSWYTLITSPEFISTHMNFTKKNTPLLVLIRRKMKKTERYTLHYDNKKSFTNYKLDFPFKSMNSYFTIIGSCNGLLCLSDDRVFLMHKIIIWNPFVKKSVLLPKPELIYNPYGSFVQSMGFGYDRLSNDYKVVRITYMEYKGALPKIELYKLSSGVWRDISYLRLEYLIYSKRRRAYIHGANHWVASCEGCYDLILSFDMCDEVFSKMRLPDSLATIHQMIDKDLMVYMESSLALIVWSLPLIFERRFCVWVMKEYGVEDSWTKHFSIDFYGLLGGFSRPLWFRECGEFIAVCDDGRVISYGTDGKEVKDLGVRGTRSEDYRRSVHVDSYTKSLVLLERGPDFCDSVTRTEFPSLRGNDSDESSGYGSDYEP